MRFFWYCACTDSEVTSGYRGIRRRSILRGGDGIPERQQPNQARYSDGDCFSGMFAAGLILYIAVKPDVHLDHILFGDMLGVTIGDIIQTVIIAGLVTLVISVKWRDFLLFSFDYQQAQVSGLHTRCLHYGLLCMVSLTIVATLKAVGIILSISLLIAHGAIAVLLTQRFHIALLLAIGISVIVSMTGVWLSFLSTVHQLRRLSSYSRLCSS